ncbi:MAG: NlpC/P60 family protein [Devosiaceae bacterium]|nr:NlpC/P60 family protein [Devosiaceae bacterium]
MNIDRSEIISAASAWIGTPYRHQASLKGAGCDCLGLIRGVWFDLFGSKTQEIPPYSRFGNDPDSTSQLLEAAEEYLAPQKPIPLPGLVVLFQIHKKIPPRHCAIFIEGNRFIHAQERHGVIVTPLSNSWQRRIHSIYAFPQRTS